ncbi:MAG: STAS domain-containing protein [Flavobacteriales bacterium]|nr:STAS domain-containing protein [Flavobacteriales bacterium]
MFHLHGRLMDQQQADKYDRHLDQELGQGHTAVVLDLAALQYMNSTGLNISDQRADAHPQRRW